MQIIESIQIALPIFAEHKNSDWEVLAQALKNAAIPPTLVNQLLEFMPLAFGRVFLDGMGIKFENSFFRYNPTTRHKQTYQLKDEVVYTESFWAASEIVKANAASQAFHAVVFRSSEVQAVNNALKSGSKPENLVMEPPILLWNSEDDMQAGKPEIQKTKSRWQFWK